MTGQSALIDPWKGLPRRIQIGHQTWRLLFVPVDHPGLESEGERCDGTTNFRTLQIHVLETLDLQSGFNTVLHELRHAIHNSQDLTEESSEEDFTNRGTNGEIALWMANPRFYTWQTKVLRLLQKEARP